MGGQSRIGLQTCVTALSLAALLLPAAAWGGTGGSSVELVLQGSIAPRCEFRDAPVELTLVPESGAATSGPMGFACNLPGAPTLSLTISSAHGALMRENDAQQLPYSIDWEVAGDTPVEGFVPTPEATAFTIAAGPAGASQAGELTVRLSELPATIHAGTYSDQITFTLSP